MSVPGTDWCGPNRSDGRYGENACGYATARSEFDQSCKDHDCCLDSAGSSTVAQDTCNNRFFHDNFGRGILRTTAATAVQYGYRPYRIMSEMLPSVRKISELEWDFTKNGPFDLDNLSNKRARASPAWEYEDLNSATRVGLERRGLKRKAFSGGVTGIRSVKRKIVNNNGGASVPRTARKLFPDTPAGNLARRRFAFVQLPREIRRAHANYMRARFRLRYNRLRRARIQRARTLQGLWGRVRSANKIKKWWKYQKRRWRHYPKSALVHSDESRIARYRLRRNYRKYLGKTRGYGSWKI